jgi:hypothetical protein
MKALLSRTALCAILVFLPACGSMKVERVGTDAVDEVHGLRVQVPGPHDVVAVLHDDAGERVVKETRMSLPAEDEFYDLGFKGGQFRSRVLNVSLHPNGTLKSYTFTSTQKLGEALQSFAEATKSVREGLEEVAEAKEEPDPTEVANAELELEILNLMLKANLEAAQNGQPLPYPGIVGGE